MVDFEEKEKISFSVEREEKERRKTGFEEKEILRNIKIEFYMSNNNTVNLFQRRGYL